MRRRPKAIVIGAGFGGLAAAIRLLARGYQVAVYDRLDTAGGRARVFRSGGHAFDAGPTVITAPFLFEELWTLCGKEFADEIELRQVDPFYRIRFDDGEHFNYTGNAEAMAAEVGRFSKQDVDGYRRFVQKSESIFRVGFEELGDRPFDRPMDMIRIVPKMIRLQSHRTVFGMVSKYIKDPRLRQVMSFHPLLVGGNPFDVTSIYSLIAFLERKWGVHYAMGGTGTLVAGLVRLITNNGGEIRLGEEIDEILTRDGLVTGVRLSNGTVANADIVVSNADAAWTYRHLVNTRDRKHWTDKRIDRLKYSMSLYVWYFGTDQVYNSVAHHTILLGNRYRDLLRDIFDRKILSKDFSLYLHRPTATDSTMAPAGCDTFYVLSPVPHLDSGTDWSDAVDEYRTGVESYLEQSVLPGLSAAKTVSLDLTPADFRSDYLSYKGAAFSIAPTLLQSAYFRPHNRSREVRNLFLVGAGTHPGAGLPGVLSSARVLDRIVPPVEDFS